MLEVLSDHIFFDTFGFLFILLLSLVYEYVLDLSPINSAIGVPAASSLNLPVTFLFVLSKYGLFCG